MENETSVTKLKAPREKKPMDYEALWRDRVRADNARMAVEEEARQGAMNEALDDAKLVLADFLDRFAFEDPGDEKLLDLTVQLAAGYLAGRGTK